MNVVVALSNVYVCLGKYRCIEFYVFDYDSLPISFQSGIAFPLVALDKIY